LYAYYYPVLERGVLLNNEDDTLFHTNMFLPSPSEWFSTSVEYKGWGRAEFVDPRGSVEGATRVSFDECGEATIEMLPDPGTMRADRDLRFGLTELLSGAEPVESKGTFVLAHNFSMQNPCTRLEVGLGLTRFREPIRVKRSGSVKGVEDGQDGQALLA
jgi:hypothetical protein